MTTQELKGLAPRTLRAYIRRSIKAVNDKKLKPADKAEAKKTANAAITVLVSVKPDKGGLSKESAARYKEQVK
jgi:hypothetical protein